MIRIERSPWDAMERHALEAYPKECCGIMLGKVSDGKRSVTEAVPCRNVYNGEQADRFEIDPLDILRADRKARESGLELIGYFHSHPDHEAYFSATDLANSWPWYSNVVLSIRSGQLHGAAAFVANEDRTASESEELEYPGRAA